MLRVRILIQGRVQGVGFRYHTCAEAEQLGVAGWVRNLPGGQVEAEFEGAEDSVEAMVAWCQRGPYMARVESATVISRTECAAPEFHGFSIRG